jgi:hypothetical protein
MTQALDSCRLRLPDSVILVAFRNGKAQAGRALSSGTCERWVGMVNLRQGGALLLLLATLAWGPVSGVPATVSASQRTGALAFLQAVASGDPQAVAQAIHPDDLRALRLRILGLLEGEAQRGDSTVRTRLFGQGMPLDEIGRLTDTGFYATLAHKLHLAGRDYASVEGLATVPDKDNRVQVVVSGRQPEDHGKVRLVNVVTLRPYGKDWKAAIPDEIEAQIDDLIAGRSASFEAGAVTESATPAVLELLATAEKSLADGKCEDYYGTQMSPNFRKVTGKKALQALISTCQNNMGTRQLLLSTLHIVRGLEPHYEAAGQRAVYDLAGQGFPYQSFTMEQVDHHWYIAE